MKTSRSITLLSASLFASSALANSLTVSIDAFSAATLFSIVPGSDLELRLVELTSPSGANSATHILIEQLSPIDDSDSGIYGSPYHAIEIASGDIQDTGVLYLQLPEAPNFPAGSVTSPIVGIVERQGAWSDYQLEDPGSSFGGASGSGGFTTPGTLNISLNHQGAAYSGSASYSIGNVDTIEMDAFSLSGPGGALLNLSATTLVRDGMNFSGTVANLTDGADYNSLFFKISLTSIPDTDSDGIPDIVDAEVPAGNLTPGQWNMTSIGSVYGISAEWGYSSNMGWVYLGLGSPWVYHIWFGWFSVADETSGGYWLHSQQIGWVYFTDSYNGYFQNLTSLNPFVWEMKYFLSPPA
jgi:hypothetical protein